jgi:hypothetical protein
LPLIAQVCDELTVEHRDDATGLAVTMGFDLAPLPVAQDTPHHATGE